MFDGDLEASFVDVLRASIGVVLHFFEAGGYTIVSCFALAWFSSESAVQPRIRERVMKEAEERAISTTNNKQTRSLNNPLHRH